MKNYVLDFLGRVTSITNNTFDSCTYIYNELGYLSVNDNKAITYDAYGNIINQTGSVISNFRYKGYYYDTDIELYYLKTRFYNPILLRFITPDSIEYLDSSSIIGLNLYAYCGNDPTNMINEERNLCFMACLAIGALVGAIVGVWNKSSIRSNFKWRV